MAASLTDVVNELKQQSNTLDSVKDYLADEANIRAQQAKADALAAKKKLEADREAAAKAKINDGPQGLFAGVKAGMLEASGLGAAGGLFGWLKGFMAPLLGTVFGTLFGGMSLATLAGRIGKMVGRGLIFGPAILLLENFGKDILFDLLTQLREVSPDWLKLSDGALRTVGDGLIDSLNTGLLFGIFFGKKGFVAGFLGNILSSSLKWLTGQPEGYWDQNFNFAGMEFPFTNDTVMLVGSTLAAYFGPSLLYGAVTKAFGGTALAYPGASVGRNKKGQFMKLKPSLATKFRGGFGSFLGAGAIALMVGETLGAYISNEFGEDSTVAGISDWLITSGQIAYMSRALGFIRAGWVGIALYTAYAISQWIAGKRDEMVSDAVKESEAALEALRNEDGSYKDPSKVLTPDQQKAFDFIRFGEKTSQFMPGQQNTFGQSQLAGASAEFAKALKYERDERGFLTDNAMYSLVSEAIKEKNEAKWIQAVLEDLRRNGQEATPSNIITRSENLWMRMSQGLMKGNIYASAPTPLMLEGKVISGALKPFTTAAEEFAAGKTTLSAAPKIQMDPYMDVNKAAAFNQGVTLTPVINSGNQTSVSTSNYNFRSEVLDPYDLMRTTPPIGWILN